MDAKTKNKHFTRGKRELIDIDYYDSLSEADQQYMLKFLREFYCGNFTGIPIHHDELRSDCYKRNYAMNNDFFNHVPRGEENE